MHVPILAGPRRRTRRALLAAALPAALAAVALPSAANAATATGVNASGVVGYSAAPGELNNVRVNVSGTKLVISDVAPITARAGCTLNAQGDAECPIGVNDTVGMSLGDKNDVLQYTAPHRGFLSGGEGDDLIFGGLRQAVPGLSTQPVFYFGDAGMDTITYRLADRGVRVDTADNPTQVPSQANDGRPGLDFEDINAGIERIEGSNFADVLFGSATDNTIIGLNGDDEIGGGDGNDFILENIGPNGADSINGGGGVDRVLYTGRATGVNVSLDGIANDGQTGERDDVRPNVENVTGSPNGFGDVLVGNGLANDLQGFGGNDNLIGGGGNDTLSGGSGNNRLAGEAGNDIINARNGELDNIDCGEDRDGADRDTANRDSAENQVAGCESGTVGVLRLTPTTVRAEAGKVARMQLSWRHPAGWRKLRTIELQLLAADGAPVGEITIRPRAQRTTDDGAVRLVRRASRLTRKGKTVTARLALRLDESLADQKLTAEVEAVDVRGRRQHERDAGTVRVAR
jgi:RTX calcium-binding nonapeptide repeat (4 copies)